MEKRAEIKVYGRVQKAGFRDFIDEIAFNLNLNGYVKNLDDGAVQVVCEGNEDAILELLTKINITQYPIRVENIDVVYKKPTGEYTAFELIRDEDLTTATYERMDAAARYIREMNSNLGGKIDVLGNKIDQARVEITYEIRVSRDNFRSHLDERISTIERELSLIKAKVIP
ncbi:hypothetical protein EO94_14580 [Methanosarcina sp. 2.H.T.1A.3]|uniref:acylphosphatase n=1 Tax=Methanosarcina sp. 2.H.T.1A.3 TaxID=1483597 RepID=UPI0006219180|nr:acylphosphatase [Methanosarcina sp. 2.H.T.1A.3]KKG17388.1 hypothetical protein EO94_14580 [Methanosarcina sp. 2.H.T.1A.3]